MPMTRLRPRLAALACLAALATPAAAHDIVGQPLIHNPEIRWLDAPSTATPGGARVRLVHGGGRAAVLNPNQLWDYGKIYRASLARLAMRMPITHRAEAIARREALDGVIARYPDIQARTFLLQDVEGGRIVPAPRFGIGLGTR